MAFELADSPFLQAGHMSAELWPEPSSVDLFAVSVEEFEMLFKVVNETGISVLRDMG
jgi:hypothetical protein